jgi:hypothetical protein
MFGVEDISMSLVTSLNPLPLTGGFVGGVQFAPEDLPLPVNATLTVQLASPPPASLAAAAYHQSDGTFFLEPITVQGNTVTIPVDRLGGIALAQMNPADINYFSTNTLSYPPDMVLQSTALVGLHTSTLLTPQTRTLRPSAPPPSSAQQFQAIFDSTVYPHLLAVQDGSDSDAILAAVNGYLIWYSQASAAGALGALAADVENANNVVKATLNNRTVIYLDAAAQHDVDAIIRLAHLRNAINHKPWGATWIPGDGQTLLDRINKMLHMTVLLDSSVFWDTAVGPVTSKVHGQVEYQPDGLLGTIKGTGQVAFVLHQHFQPDPCIVTPSLTNGVFTAFDLGAYVQPPTMRGGRYVLKDWRFKFWPGNVTENDDVICPLGSSGPILQYWFPTFGYFRKSELTGVILQGTAPQPAFATAKGWTVSQTGNVNLGTRTYHNEGEFKSADATEDSTFVIEHTPQQ